jgi:hypothetical protein
MRQKKSPQLKAAGISMFFLKLHNAKTIEQYIFEVKIYMYKLSALLKRLSVLSAAAAAMQLSAKDAYSTSFFKIASQPENNIFNNVLFYYALGGLLLIIIAIYFFGTMGRK